MRVSVLFVLTFAFQSCLYLSAQDQASRAGQQFSLAELRNAARRTDTHDQGLTAEWLTMHWLVTSGAKPKAASDYFCASIEARTLCSIPDWFRQHIIHSLRGVRIEAANNSPRLISPSEECMLRIGALSIKLPAEHCGFRYWGQIDPGDSSTCFLVSEQGAHLLIIRNSAQGVKVKKIGLTEWNESLAMHLGPGADRVQLGEGSTYFRPPLAALEVNTDGNLVFLADIHNRFLVSIYDFRSSRNILSFVAPVDIRESCCIDCIVAARADAEG